MKAEAATETIGAGHTGGVCWAVWFMTVSFMMISSG